MTTERNSKTKRVPAGMVACARRPGAPPPDAWSPYFPEALSNATPAPETILGEQNLDRARRGLLEAAGNSEQDRRQRDFDQHRRNIVLANLGIVVQIARRYGKLGLSLQDLVQEGVLGLLKAAERYDSARGFRFATYAKWWVKEAITSAVATLVGPCKVPVAVILARSKLRSVSRRLTQDLGRPPGLHELTAGAGIPRATALRALSLNSRPLSLHRRAATGGDLSQSLAFREPLQAPSERKQLDQRIQSALDSIDHRERRIVEGRFGLGGQTPNSRRELGSSLGLCAERIRQLEKRALSKLRTFLQPAGERIEFP